LIFDFRSADVSRLLEGFGTYVASQ